MLADAVVCLANAEGGTLVVGVADAVQGPAAFRGVSSRLTADVIRKGIFDRTRPSLSVPVAEITEATARLVVITVPKGAVFYANAAGTATRRIGSECRPFPPEEQRQAMAARGLSDWSAEATDLGMEAVSADEVARVRRLLLLAGREDLARSDERKLARDLRLLNSRGKLTRAGLLILGDAETIAAAIPNHGFAYQYRSSPGSESSARTRSARPFLAAVETLLDAVAVRSRVHPLSASGGVQIQIQDYPKDAVRELVVNALVHRDYELAGAVEVEHSPDSLAITSPGGLVFGITPENILTHPSTPRNRLLLETVTALQVAERTGQGIDRAYRELLRTGKVPPAFTMTATRFASWSPAAPATTHSHGTLPTSIPSWAATWTSCWRSHTCGTRATSMRHDWPPSLSDRQAKHRACSSASSTQRSWSRRLAPHRGPSLRTSSPGSRSRIWGVRCGTTFDAPTRRTGRWPTTSASMGTSRTRHCGASSTSM